MDRTALLWWIALLLQLLAIPGSLFPVLPGLVLLPLGALLWCWAVGWAAAWPVLALSVLLLALGWAADLLGLWLGAARLQASRWAGLGAAIGLLVGALGLLPALPIGGPVLGLLLGPWLGAAITEWLVQLRRWQAGMPALLRQSALVGLAVVAGLLMSKLAQALLALIGVVGFLLLSRSGSG